MEIEEKIEIRKAKIEQLSINDLRTEYLILYNNSLHINREMEMLWAEIRELKPLLNATKYQKTNNT